MGSFVSQFQRSVKTRISFPAHRASRTYRDPARETDLLHQLPLPHSAETPELLACRVLTTIGLCNTCHPKK
jgi:hypothetical protein